MANSLRIGVVLGAALLLFAPPARSDAQQARAETAQVHGWMGARPKLVIHRRLSGGYHAAVTISGRLKPPDSMCSRWPDPRHPGYRIYRLWFHERLLSFTGGGPATGNAFGLSIQQYTLGVERYTRGDDIYIGVLLNRHGFGGSGLIDERFRARIHVARNGLSGTFEARRLRSTEGGPTAPVRAQGRWRCEVLQPPPPRLQTFRTLAPAAAVTVVI
jgi:hypothetical protein